MRTRINETDGASAEANVQTALRPVASVIDLFCGAGALSYGFAREGFLIACGYDIDETCRYPFEKNNEAPFIRCDVARIDPLDLSYEFVNDLPRVLVGCAPCQPFSRYSQSREDPKWKLLKDFARLITAVSPDILSMENVPQLVRFKDGTVFNEFISTLEESGYYVRWMIANCPDFGIPQARSRLVLIASKHGEPDLPQPTHDAACYVTVRQAIANMPALTAGGSNPADPLHRASSMSALNIQRIKASIPGGTWRDWNNALITGCHKRPTGRSYASVYGRMRWDRPSPTITTQFYGYGNGRFGHPEQDRAISLREGAILQTFPPVYTFTRMGDHISFKTIGRMIGNAVPVVLAQAIARAIATHLEKFA